MAIVAYDYKAQRWINGDVARRERLTQARETLEILESPRGADYCRFVSAGTYSLAEFTASVRAEIASLTD